VKEGSMVSYTLLSGSKGSGKCIKKFLGYIIIQDKRSGVVIIHKKRVEKIK
jgi:hypothetical protein